MSIPLIIDTDTAQDDCVAILAGLLDEDADLRAITMVAGNVGFERQVQNAHMTLNVAGRLGGTPIYVGCQQPLVRPWVWAEEVHADGTGGLSMEFEGCAVESGHGVDALIRLAAERPGEITIVAIGPLTNIAMATFKSPSFVRNVKRLVVMGGSNNGRGNVTAAAEFNVYVDPEAAKAVFDAGFDITIVPWAPLTLRDAVFGRDKLAEIERIGTPLSAFFLRVCRATLEFDERVGIAGTTHPDSLAVYVALRPDLVTAAGAYHVDVETASPLTRGYTAMSWGVHGLMSNATVVESVDADRFYQLVRGLLSKRTTPNRPFSS